MFHAACAASQRPAFSPTRGSGAGAVGDTTGATGAGITAGGGGGGGGGVRPPLPLAPSPADGVEAVSGGAAGAPAGGPDDDVDDVDDVDAVDAVDAAGVAGGAAGAAAAAGGAAAVVAGSGALFPELAHAGMPNAAAADRAAASRPLIKSTRMFFIGGGSPASRSSARSQWTDRRTRPTRT